ncbi:MAG: adenylyl-sulfate kinase, partial [Devosia sp.]
ARAGEIKNFTGIDSPFEVPNRADLVLHGAQHEPLDLADQLHKWLESRGDR